MKLRNKKTGEIREVKRILIDDMFTINSLAELNEEWEDYEEPKEYWCIDWTGGVNHITLLDDSTDEYEKDKIQIGNYFETREEAEKAVEKLKAWKRLKDKGFRFMGWTIDDGLRISICSNIDEEDIYDEDKREMKPDLDLLFGGEE
jgi:hypothetical protein